MSLSGHVIAITGASKGIGYGIVSLLLSRGARVVAGARDTSPLSALASPNLTVATLDVRDPASTTAFGELAASQGCTALVANAGVGKFGPVDGITAEDYRTVMDTNVLGTLLCVQSLLPHFRSRGSGTVVCVTSDVSARTFSGGALYTASKHAQRAVLQCLAYEGREYGLRVCEIRPGMVDTNFADSKQGEEHKKGWLKPEDVAEAIAYAVAAPKHVRVDEILLHPVEQDVDF
ncbi:short-chain dehydrogenase/reductase SDR [Hyaloraphidium curvatum]|nr:short-chain dehydrogenase/reductase SDR [Hyaloraphidium curvatum]